MASRKRVERLEHEIKALEAEFRRRLVGALRKCAAGSWGLFGQNDHLEPNAFWHLKAMKETGAAELLGLGLQIEDAREKLGLEGPAPLVARFRQFRGRKSDNELGEAKLARTFLEELGEEIS